MAATNPPVNRLAGYPCSAGGKVINLVKVVGSGAYVKGTGQTIQDNSARSVDWVGCAWTVSGTYFVTGQPVAIGQGQTKWILRWFYLNSDVMTEVANGDYSAQTVQIPMIES
jgi:hypothetical protein